MYKVVLTVFTVSCQEQRLRSQTTDPTALVVWAHLLLGQNNKHIYIYISKYIVTYVVNAAAARLPLAKPSFQLRIEAIIIEYKHIYI